MKHKFTYVTYQTFPANTANSIQTISNLKYLTKSGVKIKLIFPKRSEGSNGNLGTLQKFYNFKESFEVEMKEHNYPFKDYKNITIFKKLRFHLSHFLWSKKTVRDLLNEKNDGEIYFTRSDWIFYFLNKNQKKVIYECHQVSKVRKIIVNYLIKSRTSTIIYTNALLQKEFNSRVKTFVLPNGYDGELFCETKTKKYASRVIFVGNLLRFNEDRNIQFLINAFQDYRLKGCELILVGGPNSYKDKLKDSVNTKKITNVQLLGQLSHIETIKKLQQSSVGILINSGNNAHSTHHTSPLKYFEYLKAELQIVGVDFPAHRVLPFSDKIFFFRDDSYEDFITAVESALNARPVNKLDYEKYSLEQRAQEITKVIARLEGLEPPTL
jgi:hypothetical protein